MTRPDLHLGSFHPSRKRAFRRTKLWLPVLEDLEPRQLLANVQWINPNSGSWFVGSNWSTGKVPALADDVVINVNGATPTVTIASGDVSVHSVTADDPLVVSTATLTVEAASDLSGSLALTNGTLAVAGGSTAISGGTVSGTGGSFSVSQGATLDLTGNRTATYTGDFTGSGQGTLALKGGTLAIGAASASFDFPAGLFQWTGGTITGSSLTIASGSFLTLSGPLGKYYSGGTLTNLGTIDMTGQGSLDFATGTPDTNPGTLDNAGLVDFQGDESFVCGSLSHSGTFNNSGTLLKSAGSGQAEFSGVNFNNAATGKVEVDNGSLALWAGTNAGGNYTVAAGTVLDLTRSANATFTGNYTGSGAGTVQLGDNSRIAIGSGGATFDFPAGMLQWTGGTITGSPLTIASGSFLTLSGPLGKYYSGGTLTNLGTINMTGQGSLDFATGTPDTNPGTLDNAGLVDFQGDESFVCGSLSQSGTFNNSGTLLKSAGSGQAEFSGVDFNNAATGKVRVDSGSLALWAGTNAGGNYTVAVGTVLDLTQSANATFTGNYTGSGAGTVQLGDNSRIAIGSGGATFDFPAGVLQWTGGTITGSPLTIASGSFLTLSGPLGKYYSGGTLTNLGTIKMTGQGSLDFATGAPDTNPGTLDNAGLVDFQGDESFVCGSLSQSGTFNNSGTLLKSAGSGQAEFSGVDFNNAATGKVRVDSGSLALWGGTDAGGDYTLAPGTILDLTQSANATFTGNYTGSGAGTVQLGDNSRITVGSPGATFDFPSGMLQWTAGAITGSPLTIAGGSFLTLSGSLGKYLGGGTLENFGTIDVTGQGSLDFASSVPDTNPGTLDNAGLIDFQGDESFVCESLSQSGTFTNSGTLLKSGGTSISQISPHLLFDNASGTVDVQQRTLSVGADCPEFAGGGVLSGGTWRVGGGATLTFTKDGTITTNQADIILGGPGEHFPNLSTLAANAGTLDLEGGATFKTAGNLTNSGSLIAGPASTLDVAGTFTQTASGDLTTEIGGEPASGLFGMLACTGAAALDGTLTISVVNGYGPSTGDTYTVMTYPSETGDFTTIIRGTPGGGPLFIEATNSTSVTVSATENASDLAIGPVGIQVPASASPGQPVTISYTAENLSSSTTAVSTWIDSVYVSLSDSFDSSAILVGRVTHDGAVAGHSSYTGAISDPLPPLVPGDYRIYVEVDSRESVPDPDRSNNTADAATEINVGYPTLTVGTPVSAPIQDGQEVYYAIALPAGSATLITATFAAPMAAAFMSATSSRRLPAASTSRRPIPRR